MYDRSKQQVTNGIHILTAFEEENIFGSILYHSSSNLTQLVGNRDVQ